MDFFLDILQDALLDCLKMLPVLYLAYLLMEFIEHHAGSKMSAAVTKVGRAGPLIGAALGVVPQCGFSGAIAGLYAGGVASLGTLIAVFLSTSDEMLPLLISSGARGGLIFEIVLIKFLCGLAAGFLIDLVHHRKSSAQIHDLCQREHCSCERHNIFVSAAIHCAQVLAVIFVLSVLLGLAFELGGREQLARLLPDIPVLRELVAALVGLIPSCSASVLLTELYLGGVISAGPLISGLCVNAGAGLLVLLRLNQNKKENAKIIALLYVCGVISGLIAGVIL